MARKKKLHALAHGLKQSSIAESGPKTETRMPEQVLGLSSLPLSWLKAIGVPPSLIPTEPRQKRCVIYVRVSSDRQDPASIRRQTEKARQYAADHGYIVIHVYVDYAKSGAYESNRPDFQQLMLDAKAKRFDAVIVEDGDRLARKLFITVKTYHLLDQLDVELHSVSFGRWSAVHAALIGVMADEQRKRMLFLLKSGIIKIVKLDLWPGKAPFGYYKKRGDRAGEMRKNKRDAETVRKIFELFRQGMNRSRLKDYLIANKYRYRKGKPWTYSAVNRILRNPIYMGLAIFGRTKTKTTENLDLMVILREVETQPQADWIAFNREDWIIVDSSEWRQAQELLPASKHRYHSPKFLLSQLCHCGHCGGPLYGGTPIHRPTIACTANQKKKNENRGNHCDAPRASIPLDVVERAVVPYVCKLLKAPVATQAMIKSQTSTHTEHKDPTAERRAGLLADRIRITNSLDATWDEASAAGFTSNYLSERRKLLSRDLNRVDDDLAALDEQVIAVPLPVVIPSETDAAEYDEEFSIMRDYTDCDDQTTEIVLRFRQLIGRISIVMDADRMGATINLEGPISALAIGRGDLTSIAVRKGEEIWPARTRLDDLVRRKQLACDRSYCIPDEAWKDLEVHIPTDPMHLANFDEPADVKSAIEVCLFARIAKAGAKTLPALFGARSHVLAATNRLSESGILDVVLDRLRTTAPELVSGISDLSLRLDKYQEDFSVRLARYRTENARRAAAKHFFQDGDPQWHLIPDDAWEDLKTIIPTEPVHLSGHDRPAQVRHVIQACIYVKRAGLYNTIPELFGMDRVYLRGVALRLNRAGVLKLALDRLRSTAPALVDGIATLSLDYIRYNGSLEDDLRRYVDENKRRAARKSLDSGLLSASDVLSMPDTAWEDLKSHLPSEPVLLDEFGHPVDVKAAIEICLFMKASGLAPRSLPAVLGDPAQIKAAIRALVAAGTLKIALHRLKTSAPSFVQGISDLTWGDAAAEIGANDNQVDRLSASTDLEGHNVLNEYRIPEDAWEDLARYIPCDPVELTHFRDPAPVRNVIEACISVKRLRLSHKTIPAAFGNRGFIRAAALRLGASGILEIALERLRVTAGDLVAGISDLRLDYLNPTDTRAERLARYIAENGRRAASKIKLDRLGYGLAERLRSSAIPDHAWLDLQKHLPCEPIVLKNFTETADVRRTIDACLFVKLSRLSYNTIPPLFGNRDLVRAAARRLQSCGVLDVALGRLRITIPQLVAGISSLGLEGTTLEEPAEARMARYAEDNRRRAADRRAEANLAVLKEALVV